ncbi:hypothetical protein D3C78_1721220 [compost metagenome]
MELQLDQRLAHPVAAVQTGQTALQLGQQRRQFGLAGGQIGQVAVEGMLDADRLPPPLHLHRPLVDAMGQLPQPLAETA